MHGWVIHLGSLYIDHWWLFTSCGGGAWKECHIQLGQVTVETTSEGSIGTVRAGVLTSRDICVYTFIELYTIDSL